MTASRARRGNPGGGASSATSADAARTTTPVLSPPQLRAVQHRGSDLQLIACAGSGKTETVAQRVAALIDEGVSPDAIVAFTFTERAALELKDRILKRVKERKGAAFLDRLGPMYVGTIHGYCFRLLQDHVPKYGNYDVLDEHRHAGILAREFFNLGVTAVFSGRTATADFIRTVDVIGNELIDVAALDGTPLGDCVQKYLQMLERYHFLTFGMIISKALEALSDPKVLARVTEPLRHLIVDEYQDINPAQQQLIALLTKPPVQLTVVGDDDQAIYQWRGSDLHHILNFAAERGAVHSESLDINRRSRPAIIAAANKFAQSIPDRIDKEMQPHREAGANEVVTWMAEMSAPSTIATRTRSAPTFPPAGLPAREPCRLCRRSGSGITCDVAKLEELHVQDEPTKVYLVPQKGYRDAAAGAGEHDDYVEQTREQFYASVRVQQLLFRFTQDIVDDLVAHGEGKGVERLKGSLLARHTLFPEVLRIVQKYVNTKVRLAPGVDPREIALKKYATRLRERVRDGIVAAAAPKDAPLLPIVNSFQPEVNTEDVSDYTARPVVPLKKSHLNFAPILSDWERQAIDVLEESEVVKSYTPNMRKLGFQIHYDYQDATCHYEPDFVIRLVNDTMLILEVKGKPGELHEPDRVNAKSSAARKWVAAVNNAKRYGTWDYQICREIPALAATLQELAGVLPSAQVLPFRSVRVPTEEQRFKTCVPLTTLRAAAGYWSEEQMSIEGIESIANDWIEYDTTTRFRPGMFVARVIGDSMEPLIPANSYCLFREPGIGTRQGKKLLVWHKGITDAETGGQYTVKVYESEKLETEDEWQHTRITLMPLNPKYEPIELMPREEGQVRVLAEFVEVVGAAPVVK